MRKGIHPVLQIIKIVTPQGRVIEAVSAKVFKSENKVVFVRDPGKQSEAVGQLAKFKQRFEAPKK